MPFEGGPKTPDAATAAEALKTLGFDIDPTHPDFIQFVAAAKAGNFSENLDSVETSELERRLDSALNATRDQNGYINPDDARAERFVAALESRGISISQFRAGDRYEDYKLREEYLTIRTKVNNSMPGTFAGIKRIGLRSADPAKTRPADVDIFI